MAKPKPKAKAQGFSPSKHTAAVARAVAMMRPAMDFMEREFTSRPEVLSFISKGEKLGLDRETVLKRMLHSPTSSRKVSERIASLLMRRLHMF